jgi:hypothetical protein
MHPHGCQRVAVDEDYSPPPAQIPACAVNPPGSSLRSNVGRQTMKPRASGAQPPIGSTWQLGSVEEARKEPATNQLLSKRGVAFVSSPGRAHSPLLCGPRLPCLANVPGRRRRPWRQPTENACLKAARHVFSLPPAGSGHLYSTHGWLLANTLRRDRIDWVAILRTSARPSTVGWFECASAGHPDQTTSEHRVSRRKGREIRRAIFVQPPLAAPNDTDMS